MSAITQARPVDQKVVVLEHALSDLQRIVPALRPVVRNLDITHKKPDIIELAVDTS